MNLEPVGRVLRWGESIDSGLRGPVGPRGDRLKTDRTHGGVGTLGAAWPIVVSPTSWSFRSRWLGGPGDRFLLDAGPAERTRRSAPPPAFWWARSAQVLGWGSSGGSDGASPSRRRWFVGPAGAGFGRMPSGADTEVRPPRDAGAVGRKRRVDRTVCPLIRPAGTFSPTGAKDTIQAGARGGDWEWAAVYGSDGASPSRGAVVWARPALVSEGCPAVRTQRSALPRRWCCWASASGGSDGVPPHPPCGHLLPHGEEGHDPSRRAGRRLGVGSALRLGRSLALPWCGFVGPAGAGFGGMPSGADTEVRPPATLCVRPPGGVGRRWVQWWLGRSLALPRRWRVGPAGAGFGRMPSGADTEVRPPAGLCVGPAGGVGRRCVQRWLGRSLALPWCGFVSRVPSW